MKLRFLSVVVVLLLTCPSWAGAANVNDLVAFERIKSLAGNWENTTAKGMKNRVSYEVVSGGSAVVERFEGEELGPGNAMITVYYLDGNHLQLTHYCMAKNQPHMQAEAFNPATGDLHFAFVNATGLANADAGHMHNVDFHFVDADHFSADWQFYEAGKPKFNEAVQYTRVK